MSIFRREPDPAPSPSSPRPSSGHPPGRPGPASSGQTRIAVGTRIAGTLSGAADLLIEGELEGRVELETASVVVGEEGKVDGELRARNVQVGGRVVGDVIGGEKVEILGSGVVEGDVTAPRVVIAEGAFLKGRVEMAGEKAAREQPAKGHATRQSGSEPEAGRTPVEGGEA